MNNRMITLPADLVARFEQLADQQGLSFDDLFAELLGHYTPTSRGNWALNVAEGMENAAIDWIDDQDASTNSHQLFKQHLDEKWKRTQNAGESDA